MPGPADLRLDFRMRLDRTNVILFRRESYIFRPPVGEGEESWIPVSVSSGDDVYPSDGECVTVPFTVWGSLTPTTTLVTAQIVSSQLPPHAGPYDGDPPHGEQAGSFVFNFDAADPGNYSLTVKGDPTPPPSVTQKLVVSLNCPP